MNDKDATCAEDSSITAQALYDQEFAHCPCSNEWREGAMRGLKKALGELIELPGSPYRNATAQDDAWRAGVQAGLEAGKCAKRTADLQPPRNAA